MQCWYPLLVPLKEVGIMLYFLGLLPSPMKQEQFKVCNFSTPLQKKLHMLPLGEKSSMLKYHLSISQVGLQLTISYQSQTKVIKKFPMTFKKFQTQSNFLRKLFGLAQKLNAQTQEVKILLDGSLFKSLLNNPDKAPR